MCITDLLLPRDQDLFGRSYRNTFVILLQGRVPVRLGESRPGRRAGGAPDLRGSGGGRHLAEVRHWRSPDESLLWTEHTSVLLERPLIGAGCETT